MIYKTFKEIPLVDKKLFLKAFAYMKTSNIKKIEGFVKIEKRNIDSKQMVSFALNYFSKEYNQIVQSSYYMLPKTDYDYIKKEAKRLILNKKLKKVSNS